MCAKKINISFVLILMSVTFIHLFVHVKEIINDLHYQENGLMSIELGAEMGIIITLSTKHGAGMDIIITHSTAHS